MGKKKKKDSTEKEEGKNLQAIDQDKEKNGRQTKAGAEEAVARAEALKTQGRKGCKATRINMAFTPSNHEFIKVMAKATGRTMTEMCNDIIAAYRNEHPEFMGQAKNFLEYINSGPITKLLDGTTEAKTGNE